MYTARWPLQAGTCLWFLLHDATRYVSIPHPYWMLVLLRVAQKCQIKGAVILAKFLGTLDRMPVGDALFWITLYYYCLLFWALLSPNTMSTLYESTSTMYWWWGEKKNIRWQKYKVSQGFWPGLHVTSLCIVRNLAQVCCLQSVRIFSILVLLCFISLNYY